MIRGKQAQTVTIPEEEREEKKGMKEEELGSHVYFDVNTREQDVVAEMSHSGL